MASPEPAPKTTTRRIFARCSLVSPFAAMLLMCVVGKVIGGNDLKPAEIADTITPGEQWAYYAASWAAMGLLVGGMLLGVLGLMAARRANDWDTTVLSWLGLFISGAFFTFCITVILAADTQNVKGQLPPPIPENSATENRSPASPSE